jgi:hypothetical protein
VLGSGQFSAEGLAIPNLNIYSRIFLRLAPCCTGGQEFSQFNCQSGAGDVRSLIQFAPEWPHRRHADERQGRDGHSLADQSKGARSKQSAWLKTFARMALGTG